MFKFMFIIVVLEIINQILPNTMSKQHPHMKMHAIGANSRQALSKIVTQYRTERFIKAFWNKHYSCSQKLDVAPPESYFAYTSMQFTIQHLIFNIIIAALRNSSGLKLSETTKKISDILKKSKINCKHIYHLSKKKLLLYIFFF